MGIKSDLINMAQRDKNKVYAKDMVVGKIYKSTPVGEFWKEEDGTIKYRSGFDGSVQPVFPHDRALFSEVESE